MRQLQSYSALPANPKERALSPLAKKLRLKPEHVFLVLNSPPGYLAFLEPGPATILTASKPDETYDAVQLFVDDAAGLRAMGGAAIRAVKADGLLWIAIPQTADGAAANGLPATPAWNSSDVLGEITGETGYKPIAFVKIDTTWTAMRFKKA